MYNKNGDQSPLALLAIVIFIIAIVVIAIVYG